MGLVNDCHFHHSDASTPPLAREEMGERKKRGPGATERLLVERRREKKKSSMRGRGEMKGDWEIESMSSLWKRVVVKSVSMWN